MAKPALDLSGLTPDEKLDLIDELCAMGATSGSRKFRSAGPGGGSSSRWTSTVTVRCGTFWSCVRELIEVAGPAGLMETLVWLSRVNDFAETEHLTERFCPIE